MILIYYRRDLFWLDYDRFEYDRIILGRFCFKRELGLLHFKVVLLFTALLVGLLLPFLLLLLLKLYNNIIVIENVKWYDIKRMKKRDKKMIVHYGWYW